MEDSFSLPALTHQLLMRIVSRVLWTGIVLVLLIATERGRSRSRIFYTSTCSSPWISHRGYPLGERFLRRESGASLRPTQLSFELGDLLRRHRIDDVCFVGLINQGAQVYGARPGVYSV